MSKEIFKKLALPLSSIAVFGSLYLIWYFLELPTDVELTEIIKTYFDKYGLITVFISAILEAMLLCGIYYPGSLVIFLGVIFAEGSVMRIIAVVIVATLGMVVAYAINYLLGKYGWYKLLLKFGLAEEIERAKVRLVAHERKAIFLTYWHPNFAAFTSTAAGVLRLNFTKFILTSLVVSLCWNIFWGTFAGILGEVALGVMGMKFAIAVVIIWAAYIALTHLRVETIHD